MFKCFSQKYIYFTLSLIALCLLWLAAAGYYLLLLLVEHCFHSHIPHYMHLPKIAHQSHWMAFARLKSSNDFASKAICKSSKLRVRAQIINYVRLLASKRHEFMQSLFAIISICAMNRQYWHGLRFAELSPNWIILIVSSLISNFALPLYTYLPQETGIELLFSFRCMSEINSFSLFARQNGNIWNAKRQGNTQVYE